ncbi:MAG TPA: hypothetical protein VG873_18835, partial [Burkholderiales bacterium]|nr:hypothetical protein [Burkholderiales bacterium]
MSAVLHVASCAPGLQWPGVPVPAGAAALAMQWQLERCERLPAQRLVELQFRQIRALVAHAIAEV